MTDRRTNHMLDVHSLCPERTGPRPFEDLLIEELERIQAMLLAKNRQYGNSALEPVRCFSRVDPIEQLKVRIDDKISRMMRGGGLDTEDTVKDLIGYLILLRIAQRIA